MPVEVRFGLGVSRGIPALLGDASAVVLAFAPARAMGLDVEWAGHLEGRLVDWIDVPDGLTSFDMAASLAPRVWPLLNEDSHTVLIALGGGSTLDMAKLLRAIPMGGDFEGVARVLRGNARWPAHRRAPLWLVPTTAGTGSEVTRWATFWDLAATPPQKRS
ncbi:MAG: iron-containing alcohol dehydrogenase, partial [Betaproteobacteria bacterium]|nr:iron-containing alcohol dehydrogenase [Betaproteobacteria bacterium]